MLVLLPPSESKRGRSRGAALDLARLSFPALSATRDAVLDALGEVSARPDAATVLGVSPNLTDDIARNARLRTAPATPVGQLYTGVLYDALDLASLDPAALRRARRWILVQSAAFGALRLGDKVPPYRLSMGVNLPGLGPLAGLWREPLEAELTAAAGRRLVVDCRSSTYAAAWTPRGAVARRWVRIEVPGATHNAKHTRGLVTRALCQFDDEPTTPHTLCEALQPSFEEDLVEPVSGARPWSLRVTAR
ncbi:YaaA family protein [Allobranchiibius sp. GilTou73]|uniref:YaaA family protein n=1 Tax=Allobranchiibius sp. GilTou73 TaxID=2904523 RepID=UPI001F183D31|nr:peroxide stress protein YaaA [Allobranchiibius sp. GilTou73]UIJ34242.1 peroxide stress protein YaaA [Allobranchiibius sp. GilTou73]